MATPGPSPPPTSQAGPPPAASVRRRKRRMVLIALLVFLGIPALIYFYSSWSLGRAIERALAETDALDPRWRFADLEADREPLADEANSALQIIKVIGLLGKRAPRVPTEHPRYDKLFADVPPVAQWNPEQIELIRDVLGLRPEALAEARKLKEMPRGRFATTWDAAGILVLLPHHHAPREVAELLQYAAWLQAQSGDIDGAWEDCQALANVGGALTDDPILAGFFVRCHCANVLVVTLERLLAQGPARAEAARRLQTWLRADRDALPRHWMLAVRGERAYFHKFHEPLLQGEKQWLDFAASLHLRVGVDDQLAHYFPALLTRDFPQHLRHRNELVAAARLPVHEQLDRFAELDQRIVRRNERIAALAQVLPLLPPELARGCRTLELTLARLATAEAALACERFRQAQGAWPVALADLVDKGFLDAAPADPFDGQPLRLARRPDGMVIYSIGPNRRDDGGDLSKQPSNGAFIDLGARLWDVAKRRQPPRP